MNGAWRVTDPSSRHDEIVQLHCSAYLKSCAKLCVLYAGHVLLLVTHLPICCACDDPAAACVRHHAGLEDVVVVPAAERQSDGTYR
jgi:hypothetical protein